MARPLTTSYSDSAKAEMIAHILDQLACGRSVGRITSEDDGMPHEATFWQWVRLDPLLSEELARARELGVEARLDKVQDIADDDEIDVKRANLRVSTAIKLAQMLKPKTYGNKLDLTSGGEKLEGQVNDNRLQAIIGIAAARKQKALPAPTPPEDEE